MAKGKLAQIKHQSKLLQSEGMDPQSRDDGHLEELPPLHTVTNLKNLIGAVFVRYTEPFFTKIIWLRISIRTQSCNFLVYNKHSYPRKTDHPNTVMWTDMPVFQVKQNNLKAVCQEVEGFFRTRKFIHEFTKLVPQFVFRWGDAGT